MGTQILIVDDNQDILEGLQTVLEFDGYTTIATTKGEDAIPLAREHMPKIILMDVLLSGSDGRDICKKLKEHALLKNIPVILISAHPSVSNHMECHAEGFIAKPFEIDQLKTVIQKYITL